MDINNNKSNTNSTTSVKYENNTLNNKPNQDVNSIHIYKGHNTIKQSSLST